MPEFSLSISLSTFVLLLAAVLSIALSFFVYRMTIPPIPGRIRFLLATLRAVGLFFLILLIAEPLLSLLSRTDEPPQILVLIDNSRSMTITDKEKVRSDEIRSLLASNEIRRLSEIGEVRFASFDSKARMFSTFAYDSLTFNGDATDLSLALKQVREEARKSNIRSALIISDGNNTSGSSPLFEAGDLGIPLFTIAVGDTTEQRDLLVRTVLTNTLTYAGTRVPVNVAIKSTGYGGQRVEITLRDSSKVIDRQFLTLEGGEREYPVSLSFIPEKPGMQRLWVAVSSLPDELTDRNNRATFFTKVMKSRMKIAILAGGPSADLAFFRRTLERDPNLEVTTLIEQKNGDIRPLPFNAQTLKDQDCLVLLGIPRSGTSPANLRIIVEAARNGLPIFFLAGRLLDVQLLTELEPVLPVTVRERLPNEVQCFLQISENQKGHVILRSGVPADDLWQSLPPVFQQQHEVRAKPEAQVLAFSRIQNITTNFPAVSIRSAAGRKSLAAMTYGLWRWKLLGGKQQNDALDEFIGNSIRWLTTRDDDRKVRVSPVLEFFSSRDPIEFVGQVYDDSFQPVDNARVSLSVQGGGQKEELELSSLGNGQYVGRWDHLPAGDYSFAAVVERDGATLGRDAGSFSVGDVAVEFLETSARPLVLRQLAALSGGMHLEPGQLNRLPEAIQSTPGFQSREIVRSSEIELWNAQWSMVFLLVLFAIEWFLRKRFAMV